MPLYCDQHSAFLPLAYHGTFIPKFAFCNGHEGRGRYDVQVATWVALDEAERSASDRAVYIGNIVPGSCHIVPSTEPLTRPEITTCQRYLNALKENQVYL